MKFFELELNGAFIIEIGKFVDERGFFARTFDLKQFKEKGLESNIIQCNTSFSEKKGHYVDFIIKLNHFKKQKL